ncbi:MAG: metalloprotease PmbA [Francisellaceae bacterium]|jgi:PmbA protein|nr:metalloprotease PmbA [Francisellaceae bacterium]
MAITERGADPFTAEEKIAELKNLVSDVIIAAKKAGADDVEVGVGCTKGISVEVRLGEIETIEHHQDKGISLITYIGKKKGGVSINDFSRTALKESIDAALNIAKYAEVDEYAGIAESDLLATQVQDLDLFHPNEFSPLEAIELAKLAEDSAMSFDPRITNSDGASYSNSLKYKVYGNSNGFVGGYPSTSYYLSTVAIAKDENGTMERDYDYTVSREFDNLANAEDVGKNAARHTLSRLGSKKISTTKLPVIFSAKCATGLVGHFLSAISGGAIYRKSSFLLDKIKSEIFPEFINVFERPHILKGLGSSPFDSDGLPTMDQSFIESGILQKYILSVYSARRLNMKPTANSGGVHNLSFSGDDKHTMSKKDLIQSMDKGIIVTELMGQGINIVTGDYSRGATGFYVENGEIQYPVSEITIAGNLMSMFKQVSLLGNDLETRGNIAVGSILLDEMMIAGI